MPVRYLKPGIRDSERIDRLTPQAEAFYYRILVTVDDFGRFDSRPAMLKAQCYPIKETITPKICEELLIELIQAGLVIAYESCGCKVLQVLRWENKPRASESKFREYDDSCTHLYTDAQQVPTDVPLTVTVTVTETGTETVATTSQVDGKPSSKPKGKSETMTEAFDMPDDWVVSAKGSGMTEETARHEFKKFRLYHLDKKTRSESWARQWSRWCLNWVSYGANQANASVRGRASGGEPGWMAGGI